MDVSEHQVDMHIAVTAHPHGRPDTTMALRNRLGFHDELLWKRFCVRRLNIIHALNLNTRKASEQEAQVQTVAQRLCAEYGYPQSAIRDFEKLMRAGIQSVRRNQKRSPRNHSHQVKFVSPQVASPPQPRLQIQPSVMQTLLQPAEHHSLGSAENAVATIKSLAAMCPHDHLELLTLAGEGLVKLAVSTVAANAASGESAAQIHEAFAHGRLGELVVQMFQAPDFREIYLVLGRASLRNASGALQQLSTLLIRLLNLPSSSEVPGQTGQTTLIQNGQIQTTTTTTQIQSSPIQNGQIQSTPIQNGQIQNGQIQNGQIQSTQIQSTPIQSTLIQSTPIQATHQTTTQNGQSQNQTQSQNHTSPDQKANPSELASARAQLGRFPPKHAQENATSMPGTALPGSEDRRVLLRFQDRTLELTFSPLKSTPPTLAEIIEHGRQTFAIQPDTIVRLRDVARGHIVDNNSDLLDAFCQPLVDLELFLPPPMLPRVQSFTGFGSIPRPSSAPETATAQQPAAQTHGFTPLVPMMLPPLSTLPVLPAPQSAYPPPQHIQLNGPSPQTLRQS